MGRISLNWGRMRISMGLFLPGSVTGLVRGLYQILLVPGCSFQSADLDWTGFTPVLPSCPRIHGLQEYLPVLEVSLR